MPLRLSFWLVLLLALAVPPHLSAAWLPETFGQLTSAMTVLARPKVVPTESTSTSQSSEVSGHVVHDEQAKRFSFARGLSDSDGGEAKLLATVCPKCYGCLHTHN